MRFYVEQGRRRVGFVEWEFTNRREGIGQVTKVFFTEEYKRLGRDIEHRLRHNHAQSDPVFTIGGHMPDDVRPYLEAIPVVIESALKAYGSGDMLRLDRPPESYFRIRYAQGQVF